MDVSFKPGDIPGGREDMLTFLILLTDEKTEEERQQHPVRLDRMGKMQLLSQAKLCIGQWELS